MREVMAPDSTISPDDERATEGRREVTVQLTLIDLKMHRLGSVHLLRGHIRSGGPNSAAKSPRDREDNVAHPDRRGPLQCRSFESQLMQ